MQSQPEIKKTYKSVSVNGRQVEAVIDSGSDLHLMRSSCYVKLGAPRLQPESIAFGVVGAFENRTLRSFDSYVTIDNITVDLQIHVIPDHSIDHDFFIGGELSDLVEIRLKRRQVTCFQLEDPAGLQNSELKPSSTIVTA